MVFQVKTAYGNDHQWFNDIESLTLTTNNPTGYSVSNVKGLRQTNDQREITGGDFGSEHKHAIFFLWDSTLGSDPKNGDKLTDADSVSWTVQTTTEMGREPRWRVLCTKQVR